MKQRSARSAQRGAVIIVFAVMLVVLIGFAGLVIDVGRFFVIKSELQNAADACSLAAASQLRPGMNDPDALNRAIAYGRVFTTGGVPTDYLPAYPEPAVMNRVNFQSAPVNITSAQISFSATLGGVYSTGGSGFNSARYAKCDAELADVPIYFLHVLGLLGFGPFTTQTIRASAVATKGAGTCGSIPAGICQRSADAATRGLNVGEWISLVPDDKMTPGWYGWVDFSPTAGGTPEVKDGLTSIAQCVLPVVGGPGRENGMKTSAENAWNTRFGIYSNPYRIEDIATIPPDKTGYAYFSQDVGTGKDALLANWPRSDAATSPRAYDGANSGAPNYQSALSARKSFQAEARSILGKADYASAGVDGQHDENGRINRRVVVVPVLDCNTKPLTITALACTLMLNPFGRVSGPDGGLVTGKLEYLGFADTLPCGSANTTGPLMSVLVK